MKPSVFILSKRGDLRGLFHGAIGSAAIRAVFIFSQFAVSVLLARMLGPNSFGEYTFTIAIVQLVVVFAQFGFPSFLVMRVAKDLEKHTRSVVKKTILDSIQLVVGTIGVAILAIALFEFIFNQLAENQLSTFPIVALVLIPLLALLATVCGALRGLGKVLSEQFIGLVPRPFIFFSGLILLYITGDAVTVEIAFYIHIFATIVPLVISVIYLKSLLPQISSDNDSKYSYRYLLLSSFPFLLLAGAQVINGHIDILMLKYFTTIEEVGIYKVSLQISSVINMAMIPIAIVISPQIARLHAKADWKSIGRLLMFSHRVSILIILPLSLLMFYFSIELCTFIFGAAYKLASQPLNIMVLGTIPYALVGFSGIALSMIGRADLAAFLTFITIILNIILNLLLLPLFGIEGAAIATAVSKFVVAVSGVLIISWKYHLDISAIGMKTRVKL